MLPAIEVLPHHAGTCFNSNMCTHGEYNENILRQIGTCNLLSLSSYWFALLADQIEKYEGWVKKNLSMILLFSLFRQSVRRDHLQTLNFQFLSFSSIACSPLEWVYSSVIYFLSWYLYICPTAILGGAIVGWWAPLTFTSSDQPKHKWNVEFTHASKIVQNSENTHLLADGTDGFTQPSGISTQRGQMW